MWPSIQHRLIAELWSGESKLSYFAKIRYFGSKCYFEKHLLRYYFILQRLNSLFLEPRWRDVQDARPVPGRLPVPGVERYVFSNFYCNFWLFFWQILRGSFSAVSTATIATKYSFCSIFRDLQDFHTFAPLRFQNFSKNRQTFWRNEKKRNFIFIAFFDEIWDFSVKIRWN